MNPKVFSIPSQQFYSYIMKPVLADLAGTPSITRPFNGLMGEFSVMDDVSSSMPIIDMYSNQNVLRPKEASCETIYTPVARAGVRKITTQEVTAATKFCSFEFYKGCLKDFRNNDPAFFKNIQPFFVKAVYTDIASNAYFGDHERTTSVADTWGTGAFDGIFKWIAYYISQNVIPASQRIPIADGTNFTTTPMAAYTLLNNMYYAQNDLMREMADEGKMFMVSRAIADALRTYYISIGQNANGFANQANGVDDLKFLNIPVRVNSLWTPVISQIKGSAGYAAILTRTGNFWFATDTAYGGGPNRDMGFQTWFNFDEETWKWRYYLKAGTQIQNPEHLVVAMSAFS